MRRLGFRHYLDFMFVVRTRIGDTEHAPGDPVPEDLRRMAKRRFYRMHRIGVANKVRRKVDGEMVTVYEPADQWTADKIARSLEREKAFNDRRKRLADDAVKDANKDSRASGASEARAKKAAKEAAQAAREEAKAAAEVKERVDEKLAEVTSEEHVEHREGLFAHEGDDDAPEIPEEEADDVGA